MRVGGRLQQSDLTYYRKHQILLPSKHPVTALIIRDLHLKNLHEGSQGLLYTPRQKYWPIKGIQTVKSALKGCYICFRHHPTTSNQIMGNLPKPRVTIRRAFECTAVDFVGTLTLKPISARSKVTYKAYVAMYVCLATKAVHVDLVIQPALKHLLHHSKDLLPEEAFQHTYIWTMGEISLELTMNSDSYTACFSQNKCRKK